MIFDIFSLLVSYILTFTWSFPLILLTVFDVHLFRVRDPSKVMLITNKLSGLSSIIEDTRPRGIVVGMWYIAYFNEVGGSGHLGLVTRTEIYIICTKAFFDFCTHPVHQGNDEPEIVHIYDRTLCYYNLEYIKRELDVSDYIERNNQINIIEKIIDIYNKNKKVVAYIYGKTGCGKSTVPLLIAKKLKGSFCDTFNPTDPGDTISTIYNTVMPSFDHPLILVLEEVDILIDNIHHNRIPNHKNISTSVRDKPSFNLFFDKIDRKVYPYLILVMTSNKPPEYLDDLDPCYLRPGRVDLKIEMKEQ